MKKINFSYLFCCFSIFFCTPLFAQIKVDTIGRLRVGTPNTLDCDLNLVTTMQLFGRNSVAAGSKLSLGDFGRKEYNSWNVFVAEYDTIDTDQLWLHGKNGLRLTYFNSDAIAASFDPLIDNCFRFYTNVQVYGNLNWTSDERLKENIRPIQSALSSLQQINGVMYNYKQLPVDSYRTQFKNLSRNGMSEKEMRDLAIWEEWAKRNDSKKSQLGFSAQEVRKVFPELVSEDKDGNLSLNYIGLIPVLVESIKEQQKQIEELQNLVNQLTGKNILRSDTQNEETTYIAPINAETATMEQNTPNPFNHSTVIHYTLSETCTSAKILITNTSGHVIEQIPLSVSGGHDSITIKGGSLQAGVYLYSLICDGKVVDTKRMVLTK